MDLTPDKQTPAPPARPGRSSDGGVGRGMEFAILTAMFLGLGYVIDRAAGTKPLFMIVLVVVSLVGQFASMWYGYDARMKELEAERQANSRRGKAAAR